MTILAQPVLRRPPTPRWAKEVSAFLAGCQFDDLPQHVVSRTIEVILDTIGVMAAGAQEPEIGKLASRLAQPQQGHPLIGLGRRGPAAVAALINGTAGTMLELDEGNQYARGHPGIHVVPAALIAAENVGASGRDLILATALGYEVGARIGIASKLRVTMHPHGTWGTIGAAAAVARLNGASTGEINEAMSVASSLGLSTSRRTMLEGGTVRNTFAGWSNQIGLAVWDLVAAGFSGEADGVGTVYGGIIAEDWRPDEMVAELGTRWEIARNYFKRHACCRYNHGALDALADIVSQSGGSLSPDDVEQVAVDTYVWAAQLASREPENMLAAKFSLPFAIATTLAHGTASVEAFRDAARSDPAIRGLARRVTVREDPALTARLPALRPARVHVHLRDGRSFSAERMTNKGDTEDPYSEAEVIAKFRELTRPIWGEPAVEALVDVCRSLPQRQNLSGFFARLAA